MSALITSEIFRLFLNTLTPDDKYSRRNMQTFWQQVQAPLSQKAVSFFLFLWHFWNVLEIENILKQNKSILAYYNWNYWIWKRCLLKRLKGLGSEHHVNWLETLLKLARHHYFPTFPRTRNKLSWRMSALVTSKIFRLFLNTWIPMTSIPVPICRFSDNKFKHFYLKKEGLFVDFGLHFWNMHEI